MTTYEDVLLTKMPRIADAGIHIPAEQLNGHLFPFQRHIAGLALRKGRFAIFGDCGLGKTLMQLAWADRVAGHTGKPVLILCPLAVVDQTIEEGRRFGIIVLDYARFESGMGGIFITNYEQLSRVSTDAFSGVVLDESSILKNFEGATRNLIIDRFSITPYKLPCTATPSPNDPMELGNHAEFLGIMSRTQMLAMYFVHDGGDTSQWRLKKHAEARFWQWVSSWAIMLSHPEDVGFPMEGYTLPGIELHEHQIITPKRDNGMLVNDTAINATNYNQELRLTKTDRLTKAAEIVNASTDPFIVWIKQDEEADFIMKLIPDAVEVRGSMPADVKKSRLLGFAKGEFRVLVTKTKIASFGLNYQHCAHQVFASLDFSFESTYQAIRRSLRFGQKRTVHVWLITTDTMQNVVATYYKKKTQFEHMQRQMNAAYRSNADDSTRLNHGYQPIKLPTWLTTYQHAC